MRKTITKKIVTTAIMFALSTVLSLIIIFRAPYGGSITLVSMLPLILISVKYKSVWGFISSCIYGILQMFITGIPAPPVQNFISYVLVVLLDYVFAFGVLGFAGFFEKLYGEEKRFSLAISTATVIFLRFICHFLSGIIIWGVYAPEGTSPAIYSLLYNGSYMLFELIITTVIVANITPKLKKL